MTLQTAVQAVIAEWEEHGFATDGQMEYLRKALEAEQAQETRTALEQYDLDQSADYQKGWNDGRIKGYEVGHRYATEAKQAQAVEPVCSQCKGLGYYDEGHENDDGSMSGGNYVDCACNKKDFTQCTTVTNDCLGGCKSLSEHQNYTHPAPPAQQVAVPMPESQIDALSDYYLLAGAHECVLGVVEFVRAIEAHHKIGEKP